MNVLVNVMHQAHPMAAIFRPMDDKQLALLADDLKQNGQREAIVLAGDLIVDGRSREKACQMIGLVPARYIQWEGTEREMFDYIIMKNIGRRDLTLGSKAMAAARITNIERGSNPLYFKPSKASLTTFPVSSYDAAELFGLNSGTIRKAKAVLLGGEPDVIESVERNAMSIARAYRSIVSAKKTGTSAAKSAFIADRRYRSNVYGHLKTAIEELNSLPNPTEVAAIAQAYDRSGLLTKKLPLALAWLQEFFACLSSKS